MSSIRVVHFGLGPIGAGVVRQIAARPGFTIVGAIDVDPAKVGLDLGRIAGLKKKLGVTVQADAAKVLKSANPAANAIVVSFMILLLMLPTQTTNGPPYSIVPLKSF